MLGLSLDKVLVVLVVTAFVVGPARLPEYAGRLAELVRAARAHVDALHARTQEELQVPLAPPDWSSLDPRRYDPRRIVQEALREPSSAPAASRPGADGHDRTAADPVRADTAYAISGSSGHPRRTRIRPAATGDDASARGQRPGPAAGPYPDGPAGAGDP